MHPHASATTHTAHALASPGQSSKRRLRKRTSSKSGKHPTPADCEAAASGGHETLSPLRHHKSEADSDTEESDESDVEPSSPSECGDREEFFEALEVLHQHDYFVATSIKHSDGVDLNDSPEQVTN